MILQQADELLYHKVSHNRSLEKPYKFVYRRFNHRSITPWDCVPFAADVIKNKKQTVVMKIINLPTSWLGLDVSHVTLHTIFFF